MTRCSAVLLAAAALAAAARRAPAQPPADPLRLTLAEAVDRARQNSPRIEELRALRSAAEAAQRGARAERLPQVELAASYTRRSNVPELVLAFPGQTPQTVFPNLPNDYRTGVSVALPLYTGGRASARISAAEHELRAAGLDVDAGMSELVLETVTAYWSLVTARENERVLAQSIAAFEADLKQVRDRQEVGLAARSDVLNVQVERDRAELARLQAANDLQVASADLVRLLGLPAGAAIEPTEAWAAPGPEEEVEALVAQALEERPEISGLRSRAAAAEADITAARSAGLPQASLHAGYDYARPNPRILPLTDSWDGTWNVGVSVSFRAFDGGRTSAATAGARARAEAVRRRLVDLERRVRLDVTARVFDLATRRAALEVAERNLEAARENVRVSQDRYHEGLIPVAELLDAESRLLRAGLDRTTLATLLQQARANLDRAVGK
jgi:outer membrane protein